MSYTTTENTEYKPIFKHSIIAEQASHAKRTITEEGLAYIAGVFDEITYQCVQAAIEQMPKKCKTIQNDHLERAKTYGGFSLGVVTNVKVGNISRPSDCHNSFHVKQRRKQRLRNRRANQYNEEDNDEWDDIIDVRTGKKVGKLNQKSSSKKASAEASKKARDAAKKRVKARKADQNARKSNRQKAT